MKQKKIPKNTIIDTLTPPKDKPIPISQSIRSVPFVTMYIYVMCRTAAEEEEEIAKNKVRKRERKKRRKEE
jgi:hypothetical protein